MLVIFLHSVMALSLLPTAGELATLNSLDAIRQWSGCPQGVWDAASAHLGTVPNVRVLALTPLDVYKLMLERVRIPRPRAVGDTVDPPPRECSAVEVIQLAVMWRVSRLAYSLPDIDILAPDPGRLAVGGGPAVAPAAAAAKSGVKKIKMSVHLDQLDDNEVEVISRTVLEECYRNFREVTGSEPVPEADPTLEQVTAMRSKVIDRGESPYADFSVLVPFGRELVKNMKTRSWLLQEDGTFKGIDIPGPPSFVSWLRCWRVFRTVLLMLKHNPVHPHPARAVVTIAALEEYADKIYELCNEFPECWHLVWQAEDRCRRDEFERIRRHLTRARISGTLPMNIEFDPAQPWVGVFTFASRDGEYWAKHVIRPAQTFLARGGGGKPMSREAAEGVLMDKDTQKLTQGSPPGEGKSRNARKRRAEKEKKYDEPSKWASKGAWSSGSSPSWGTSSWTSKPGAKGGNNKGGNGHPKKYGQLFVTTREGDEICYKFAKGAAGSCSEPCGDGRVHCCQYCLGQHQNASCPKGASKAGKGGGGSGGAKSPGK